MSRKREPYPVILVVWVAEFTGTLSRLVVGVYIAGTVTQRRLASVIRLEFGLYKWGDFHDSGEHLGRCPPKSLTPKYRHPAKYQLGELFSRIESLTIYYTPSYHRGIASQ